MEYIKEAQQLIDKSTGKGIYPIARASDLKNDDGTPYVLPAQLKPSGTDTSTKILAFQKDKGIWVGTDTGHWYYFNRTKYVDGGVFISSLDNLKLDLKLDIAPGKNLFDKTRPLTASSYVNGAGIVVGGTSEYRVTDYIPAKPNKKYQTNIANGAGFIGCYDSNLNPLGKCHETANTDGPGYHFTTLANTAYIRLTYLEASYSANINKAMVIEGDNARLLLSYAKYIKYAQDGNCSLLPFGIRIDQDTFVSPSNIVYDAPCNKKNSIISFTATFTGTLNNLIINHGLNAPYADSFLIIYSDRIEVWGSESGTDNLYISANHGLTLTESISVIINNYDIAKAKITLTCPNGTFSLDTKWTGYSGQILVRNDTGLTLNNAHFVYSALDLNASVWCFGDSYLEYRPKNIMKMGYKDIMFDGFGGRQSESGITGLRQLLSYKIPKVVLWCLGMNDGDSDSAINSSWQTCANQLVDLSNKYNFEIVFTTIPCTPIINNSFKNAWIKNSGFRYIDIAAAVGGTNVGSTWFSGLLSPDNIHPTYNYGEQVIASTIAAGLPEINRFGYPTIDKLDVLNDSMIDIVNSLTVKDGIVLIRYQGTAKRQIANGESFLAIGGEYYPPEIAGTRLSVVGEIEWAARLFFVSKNNGGIYVGGTIEKGQFVSFTLVYFLGSWNDNLNLN